MSGRDHALAVQLERRAQAIKAEIARLRRELTEVQVRKMRALGLEGTPNRRLRRNPEFASGLDPASHNTKPRRHGGNHNETPEHEREVAQA